MTRSAAIAVYASTVSEARVIIARSAAFVKTASIRYAPAETAVPTALSFAPSAVKNANPVLTISFVLSAEPVSSASGEKVTSAKNADSATTAWIWCAFAVVVAQTVQ